MQPPDDLVARRVLPTLRAMVAERLDKRGLTEREIAERMGVTQGAVSKYLRGRGKNEPAVSRSTSFQALADRLASGMGDGEMSRVEALVATLEVLRAEEDRGLICTMHEEEVPELRGLGCDLCVVAGSSDMRADQEALGDLRAALRTLEAASWFPPLIPSVGSNLARAKKGATSSMDVAAVPGRIFEMRGAVRVPAAPEFGASKHVAEVALAAQRAFPDLNAALNVRADAPTIAAVKALRWPLAEFDAAYEGRGDRIEAALKKRKKAARALFHRGGFGIEPIMYLVGPTAASVVALAEELASRRLSA